MWARRARGGAPVRLLAGHSWYATAVAFRPGSSELASASMDKTIRLWRYEEEESVGAPSPSLHDESTAASSAPLQLLDDDDDDADGGTETPLAPAPHVLLRLDAARSAADAPSFAAAAGGDASAPIRFDCRGGTPVRLAEFPGAGHRGAVVQIAVAADGSLPDGAAGRFLSMLGLGDNNDAGGLRMRQTARTGGASWAWPPTAAGLTRGGGGRANASRRPRPTARCALAGAAERGIRGGCETDERRRDR